MSKITTRKRSEEIYLRINGVNLNLRLDYDEKTASFVNNDGTPAKFVFIGRGTEYLGGWVKIFQALEEATKFADKLLREQKEVRKKEKFDETVKLMTEIAESEESL